MSEISRPRSERSAHAAGPVSDRVATRWPRRAGAAASVLVLLAGATGIALAALPPVPQPPENPVTESKRVLGKILFWDEQLSTSNAMSCASCHSPARGGTDGRQARHPGLDGVLNTPDDMLASPGVVRSDGEDNFLRDPVFGLGPQVTSRAANSVINAAYAPQLFWDGRASGQFVDPQTGQIAIQNGGALESQAVNPPVSGVEMGHDGLDWNAIPARLSHARPLDLATAHPADVAGALADRPSYPELFRRAFGDTQITARRIAFAIATYERTLISDQTPWDRTQAGQPGGLTQQQAQGLQTFQNANCTACHAAPTFTGQGFRNIGLRPPGEDLGRQVVTGLAVDRGRFKVPGLRNVGLQRSFMHNGQFADLTQLVRFYARAPQGQGQPPTPQFQDNIDPVMATVRFPPQQEAGLVAFLTTGLTDPRVAAGTFPFDHPTLFADRPTDRVTTLGGGASGAGGTIARLIAPAPPMVGNLEFRIGLDGAVGGASVRLGLSTAAPVGGRITPSSFLGPVTASGVGAGQGVATMHWPLVAGDRVAGEVLFAQWFITDPAAQGGVALSDVVRIPFFCGSSGCPAVCMADYNRSGEVDGNDISEYINTWYGDVLAGTVVADFNGDGETNGNDISDFINSWYAAVVNGGFCA